MESLMETLEIKSVESETHPAQSPITPIVTSKDQGTLVFLNYHI